MGIVPFMFQVIMYSLSRDISVVSGGMYVNDFVVATFDISSFVELGVLSDNERTILRIFGLATRFCSSSLTG